MNENKIIKQIRDNEQRIAELKKRPMTSCVTNLPAHCGRHATMMVVCACSSAGRSSTSITANGIPQIVSPSSSWMPCCFQR